MGRMMLLVLMKKIIIILDSFKQRCDGKNDCPLTETSTGGEDEENCDEGSGQV